MAGSRSFTYRDYKRIEKQNEEMKEDLIQAYTYAKQEMLSIIAKIRLGEIVTEDLDYTNHYRSIIRQIDNIVDQLNTFTEQQLKELIPRQYALGQMNGEIDLNKVGIPLAKTSVGTFSVIDQNAVKGIIAETFEDLFRSNQTMSEYFKRTLRQITKEQVIKNVISGDPVKMSSEQLRDKMLEQGFKGYTKRNGDKIDVDNYARLVLHTKTMQAHNDGTILTMTQEGFDLVQVSYHKSSCDTCSKYENKIYSISGTSDKYPPVSSMPNGGPPFHPHCRHVLKPYIEKFHSK
ncbi:hypothetical protein KK120_18650 [Virgibacillus dakarensis]|nr:hypothetical protein [Virgibacillus dakarensis]